MSQTVTCPHCRTLLRSDRPIPAGSNLRCPDCRETFLSPEVEIETPTRSAFGTPLVIAVAVSVLLGGSIVTAALILASRRPEPVVKREEPKDERKPDDGKRLEEERQKLAKAQAEIEEQKKKLEHSRILARAEAALNKGNFAEAEKLYGQALDLVPTDAETVKGLVAAKTAMQTEKKGGDDRKKADEVASLVAEGKKALQGKQYAAAVRAFEAALALAPGDKTARDGLNEAKDSLDADAAEKKKLADYRKAMDAGKLALKAEQFADAVREFQAALRLMPEDLEAAQGVKQAEAKIANEKDKEKKQAAFTNLTDRARNAQAATKFNEAIAALEAALRIIPEERDAVRDLRNVKAALKRARSENQQLLVKADEALKLGQVDEARRLCADAVKNWAEDAQAEKALRNVDRLAETAKTNQVAYARAVEQGALAMATNRYAAAVNYYLEAVRLMPTDLESARQLRLARAALENEVKARVEYDRQMKLAAAAMAQRNYAEAIRAYQAALKILPEDVLATNGLSRARYSRAITEGQRALTLKRKREAIAAFEAALNEKPGDLVATNGLRQANQMR